jgi:hypothetical protein
MLMTLATGPAAQAAAAPCKGKKCTADTTLPAATIVAPGAGQTLNGTTAVTGTATDNVRVAKVEVRVDSGAYTLASGTGSWTYSLDTTALGNAGHQITARATDASGNTTTASVSVQVSNPVVPPPDTTPPAVAIASPAGGSSVAGTITVSGTASDDTDVTSVSVGIDGSAPQAASGASSWSALFDTTAWADGSHTIVATALDAAANLTSASATVTFANEPAPSPSPSPSLSPSPSPSPSPAPTTSATHMVTPEGVTIDVNTAGAWTAQQIYDMLKASAIQLNKVGPTLTVKVQDVYPSQTTTSAGASGGVYDSFAAIIYLKGVNSSFVSAPDATLAHEYGHAWAMYHLFISHNGHWSSFLDFRGLTDNPLLDSSYSWGRNEIIADDYRLLFGSSLAISQRPMHMNTSIPDPRNVPGLKDFFLNVWAAAG